ncbi:protein RRP6-like 3 isoform X3 [Capsella rubella]|uniref:protein RRP6-like 3 isoform X3 n=1 Tax=Capsella rubella TaxID=81985 RepID=UPI000CD5A9D7|nr:protein RRP6-like 3 isoform X3 [Capsella rubella]
MEVREKAKIVITVASLVAVTVLFVTEYRRRRHRRKKTSHLSSCYLHSELKPQFGFKRVLADNSYSEFKHLKLDDASSSLEKASNCHPYEAEITVLLENIQIEFGFLRGECSLEMSDSYVWVERESQLKELAEILAKEKVFAVDTEQHSFRSFLGFTALIQISTHEEDFLVDTIALHDAMNILRPVFSDPNICKVFHGADNDVLWLQRDFHIYVVNMFDTAKACEVLSKPQRSLAYLLEAVCGVATNKSLQREDWRQRPLSKEMVQYARTDAHYLLYIADTLTAELIQLATEDSSSPDDKFHFLLEASRRSNMTCLQLYTKETEDFPGSAVASSIIYRHLNGHGDNSTISVNSEELVRKLCAWRDLMARIHDESTRYVLSDQAIVSLACKQPTKTEEIYDTIAHTDLASESSPSFIRSSVQSPYPVICSHLDDIYQMILNKLAKLDEILPVVLKNCLGTNGTCPISVFNYSLLVNFKTKLSSRSAPKKNGHKNFKQFTRLASRELFVKKFSCKAPVYHNCRIYANDGRLLCYCDKRKLEWYLNRGLAKLVEENPPAIMLLFEPKGRPEDEGNDFYIQTKKNICVGCGEGKHYLRYRIIPSCYRVHFPEHLKTHRSHDIVLLCVDCHEVAHAAAERYKKQIATEFGIPLFVRRVLDSKEAQGTSSSMEDESMINSEDAGVSPLHLRSAAMALLRHGNRMPSSRREELLQIVKMYYGGRDICDEDLERALLIGLSPHERRKLERKKGVSLKNSAEATRMDKQENGKKDNDSLYIHNPDASLDENNDEEAPANCAKIMNVERITVTDDSGDGGTSEGDGATELNDTQCNGNMLHQQNSKLSLLGHGPHGKQIVEYLLREYGEDGVRDFCQRWRKVFVDAVHPRHLPGGWNVSHSGRRDFGEFSVYNPTKRLSTE